MKEKFDEFRLWVVNQGIELSDKTNIYQCMDLAYSWVFYLNFPKATIQHLYAYQVFTQPSQVTKQYFDVIPNTPDFVPAAGDLIVFDKTASNIAGHISVATGKGGKVQFESLDQNWAGQSKATIVTHNYDNPKVLGVLRPKPRAVPCEITPQTKIPQIGDKEVQAIASELGDLKRDNLALSVNLADTQKTLAATKEQVDMLIKANKDLEVDLTAQAKKIEQLLAAQTGSFTNPVSRFLYELALKIQG